MKWIKNGAVLWWERRKLSRLIKGVDGSAVLMGMTEEEREGVRDLEAVFRILNMDTNELKKDLEVLRDKFNFKKNG